MNGDFVFHYQTLSVTNIMNDPVQNAFHLTFPQKYQIGKPFIEFIPKLSGNRLRPTVYGLDIINNPTYYITVDIHLDKHESTSQKKSGAIVRIKYQALCNVCLHVLFEMFVARAGLDYINDILRLSFEIRKSLPSVGYWVSLSLSLSLSLSHE